MDDPFGGGFWAQEKVERKLSGEIEWFYKRTKWRPWKVSIVHEEIECPCPLPTGQSENQPGWFWRSSEEYDAGSSADEENGKKWTEHEKKKVKYEDMPGGHPRGLPDPRNGTSTTNPQTETDTQEYGP